MKFERNEYPRPQFRRESWQGLNGAWEFEFDDEKTGEKRGLHLGDKPLDKSIIVPFSYQYEASGIGDKTQRDVVWYRRKFTVEKENEGRGALLCFNGVDYKADVFINGIHAVSHVGGFAPFSTDISRLLKEGENVIVVRCEDSLIDSVPRGKQSWTGDIFACFYLPNTGIWQSVWIDFFDIDCIESYTLVPDLDDFSFGGEITTLFGKGTDLEIVATFGDEVLKREKISLNGKQTDYTVKLVRPFEKSCLWWDHSPNLINVEFTLFMGEKVLDRAKTRFGMRKISVENGKICLNHVPLYQRLVLDQGYWQESGLTPTSVDAIRADIVLAKKMGFNGARKHQKFEDPYYYYIAEEEGFITWCEMPSAYRFCENEIRALTKEWLEILAVAKNFTSNLVYVPLNESWGVRDIYANERMQDFAKSLYYLTKTADPSRLVSTNDGFENLSPSDILSVHDYDIRKAEAFPVKYGSGFDGLYPQGWPLFAKGYKHGGEPVLLTEFGGIAMVKDAKDGAWGYNEGAKTQSDLLERLKEIFDGIRLVSFQGYCYTQLTDVQQEVNGLLYADRTPKVDLDRIKEIVKG